MCLKPCADIGDLARCFRAISTSLSLSLPPTHHPRTPATGQVLGTDDLFAYVEKYRMTLDPHYEDLLGRHQRKPWVKFINPDVQHLCSEEGLNFLSKLLVRQLRHFLVVAGGCGRGRGRGRGRGWCWGEVDRVC